MYYKLGGDKFIKLWLQPFKAMFEIANNTS